MDQENRRGVGPSGFFLLGATAHPVPQASNSHAFA